MKLVDVEVYEFLLQVYFSTNCISCLSENSTMSRKVVICIAFAYVKELSNFVVCKMGKGGGGGGGAVAQSVERATLVRIFWV